MIYKNKLFIFLFTHFVCTQIKTSDYFDWHRSLRKTDMTVAEIIARQNKNASEIKGMKLALRHHSKVENDGTNGTIFVNPIIKRCEEALKRLEEERAGLAKMLLEKSGSV